MTHAAIQHKLENINYDTIPEQVEIKDVELFENIALDPLRKFFLKRYELIPTVFQMVDTLNDLKGIDEIEAILPLYTESLYERDIIEFRLDTVISKEDLISILDFLKKLVSESLVDTNANVFAEEVFHHLDLRYLIADIR